ECDTIESIMDNELSGDREKDFVDLVYCIETAITNDFVKEEEILPVFYKLFGMKNKLEEIDASELTYIQKEIKGIINLG
ncbi:MAG TPA: hypothetical protein VKY40_10185, partial [Halanaerobiales bacterium]|nr:hypothetical protein [Halanaerobiales bacterium]